MLKKNCWEVKRCGREPGSILAEDFETCPATLETKLDGVHGGKNAGRCCWIVSGTLCFGTPSGKYAQKIDTCEKCDFYHRVWQEESQSFSLVFSLLGRLKEKSEGKKRSFL